MSLEDSVDLVLHAFKHANQGDIFVQKAPASTIEDLALALQTLFKSKSKIKVIGTRHGENYTSLFYQERKWQKLKIRKDIFAYLWMIEI